ncbi:DedA family protein/thiosulfate sulfurtransferase GlpE [Paraburkholderia terricola]|uniref:Membrane protein DedA with SNARE-associated domain/rhodanese-related sulfurtransferase n=2 Tax=Paraburkholderia terricola TaxID=169427 RepID=A0ABU1M133_9BURK|nr:membrane protein DedA with SNARE-associated domain/rhodanese-related sulfurtransferase [Paraburkholderia terricola]MDR6485277.1 membrane protein DedA with SNARE-associated domain/rhodanese-related sulfurtransferase [Paraburkholderia terricola]
MMSHELIARYGILVVFLNVLGSSLGLPLPVLPTLITVGASTALAMNLASSTYLNFATILGSAVIGGVLGDLVWFQGGKRYGERTLHTVCKLSLSRETCVRKTERFFGRWGVRVLIVARFVPGLSLVAVPLCGAMAVRLRSFVLHDCVGVALWAFVGLAIGALFASQIDVVFVLISRLGWQALIVIATALMLYVLYRYCRRIMLAKALEKARISVAELHALLANNPRPILLDIRSAERRMLDPFVIPGAEFADEQKPRQIVERYGANRTLVIYCSCPNEISAAWMAGRLRQAGVKLALPLTGGIDAWRLAGFDVEPIIAVSDAAINEEETKLFAH